MANSTARLTDLNMADLERLYRVMSKVDAADTAVNSVSWPAKHAVRQLLKEAYFEARDVARKGAPMALKKIQAGAYSTKQPSEEFCTWLVQMADQNARYKGAGFKEGG